MRTLLLDEPLIGRHAGADRLGLLAVLIYVLSFFLPALPHAVGYQTFVFALVFVIGVPMWAANPVFWIGLGKLYQGEYRTARTLGVVALLLALSECWLFSEDLRVGYFAWVGSMAGLALAGWWGTPPRWPVLAESERPGEASRIAARFPSMRPGLLPEQTEHLQTERP
jgi:hypothetical protein